MGKSCITSTGVRFGDMGAAGKIGVCGRSVFSRGSAGLRKHLHAFLQVGAVRHDADAV